MNSYTPILTAEMAIQRANQWAITAKSVIAAYLELDQIDATLRCECDKRTGYDASQIVTKAMRELRQLLEDLRDEAVANELREPRNGATDAEWDVVEEFNDAVGAGVISVDAAVKRGVGA